LPDDEDPVVEELVDVAVAVAVADADGLDDGSADETLVGVAPADADGLGPGVGMTITPPINNAKTTQATPRMPVITRAVFVSAAGISLPASLTCRPRAAAMRSASPTPANSISTRVVLH
jgi:hypothetical protein